MKIEPWFTFLSLGLMLLVAATQAQQVFEVGPGESIQAAIDAANQTDSIWVKTGEYHESINVNKPGIYLGGWNDSTNDVEPKNGPIIYGSCNGTAVTLSADGIILEGFQIKESNIGVLVNSNNSCVDNNIIDKNNYGITLTPHRSNISIGGNEIKQNIYGLYLYTSRENKVEFNKFKENGYSIYSLLSNFSEIDNNKIVADNKVGIFIVSSNNNNIFDNDINNSRNGLIIKSSHDNMIYNNHFVGNKNNVFDNGCNRWYKIKYYGIGNYYGTMNAPWEGCKGFTYAMTKDKSIATCDSVYPIIGGSNIDLFPKAELKRTAGPSWRGRHKKHP